MKCQGCGADLSPLELECRLDVCEWCHYKVKKPRTDKERIKDLEHKMLVVEQVLKTIKWGSRTDNKSLWALGEEKLSNESS